MFHIFSGIQFVAKNTNSKPNIMKSPIKMLITAVLSACLITSASAEPPGKGLVEPKVYKQAATEQQIGNLKKGDRYAMVCMSCKSVTVKEVANDDEAKTLCHNGGSVHCDSCKKKMTIKNTGPPGKSSMKSEVMYVNSKGEQCMFLAPMN